MSIRDSLELLCIDCSARTPHIMDQTSVLPTEMLVEIFRFLTTDDVRAVRLVNHRLHDAATPLLMDTVVLSPHQARIDRFKAICNNEKLSRLIKNIHYDTTYFLYVDYMDFYASCFHGFYGDTPSWYKMAFCMIQKKHQLLVKAQVELVIKMRDILSEGLRALPRVTTVSLVYQTPTANGSTRLELDMPDRTYNSYSQDEMELINKYQEKTKLRWFAHCTTSFPSNPSYFAFTGLMQALFTSDGKVTALRTSSLEEAVALRASRKKSHKAALKQRSNGFVRQFAFRKWLTGSSPPSLPLFRTLHGLKNLKTLSLGLIREMDLDAKKVFLIPKLLHDARGLEDLALGFNTGFHPDIRDDLEDWFGVSKSDLTNLRRLKRLALFSIQTTQGSMKLLLEAMLEGNMQELVLKDIYPSLGDKELEDWTAILDDLRALRLRKIYLGHVTGFRRATSNQKALLRQILDYVLQKSGKNPLAGKVVLKSR